MENRENIFNNFIFKGGMMFANFKALIFYFLILTIITSPNIQAKDLTDLSIEELMNLQVTTVSRGGESLFETPAAIYAINQEDIQRSGINNIPDLLRMIPGVHVAKQDASTWVMGIRGASTPAALTLLVMIDGRSIYNNIFSGVLWNLYDLSLNDVERIEVIRGPGGTLWGTNAVNGIINIITKHARDTQKGKLSVGGGYPNLGFGDIRYGGSNKEGTMHYRFSGKYSYDQGASTAPGGLKAHDHWQTGRIAFRLDWDVSSKDTLRITSDFMAGKEAHTDKAVFDFMTPPYNFPQQFSEPIFQSHVMAKWDHNFSDTSVVNIQTFYNVIDVNWPTFTYQEHTFDIDLQHRFNLGSWNQILWGAGYRFIIDNTDSNENVFFTPEDFKQNLFTWFIQDKITIVKDKLFLTVGSKFEHNEFSGFEFQPSGRLLWTPHHKHTFWAAFTRSVKTPNAIFENINQLSALFDPGTGLTAIWFNGNDVESWKVLTGEIGYRTQPTSWAFLDLTGFYSYYDDVIGYDIGTPEFITTPVPHVSVPVFTTSDIKVKTYGIEFAGSFDILPWWKVKTSFSYLKSDYSVRSGGVDPANFVDILEENDPDFLFHVRSYMDLPANFEINTAFYFTSDIGDQEIDGNQSGVNATYRLDVQVAWKPKKNIRLSLVGQNLLNSQKSEFNDVSYSAAYTDVPRSFYGKFAWDF